MARKQLSYYSGVRRPPIIKTDTPKEPTPKPKKEPKEKPEETPEEQPEGEALKALSDKRKSGGKRRKK